jgi:hypothetical protein
MFVTMVDRLGTTRKAAGSAANFEKIDGEYVLALRFSSQKLTKP